MHAARNIITPGATPLWTASAAQSLSGVTPGVMDRCMRLFWPRAYTDVSNPKCREVSISNKERRTSRWQY